jgi:predicted transcriptional regulator
VTFERLASIHYLIDNTSRHRWQELNDPIYQRLGEFYGNCVSMLWLVGTVCDFDDIPFETSCRHFVVASKKPSNKTMAGSLPAKKRRVDPVSYIDCSDIEIVEDPKKAAYADDSSSAASFLSPKSLDSDEEEFEFETGTHALEEGSQESASPFSIDLGTQPPPKTPTANVASTKPKKRKVSMSPTDTLTRTNLAQETPISAAPKRSSPRGAKKKLPTHNQESKKRPAASMDVPAEVTTVKPRTENPISVHSTAVTPAPKKSKVMDLETEPPVPAPKTTTSTKTVPTSSTAFEETLETQSTPAAAAPKAKAAPEKSKAKLEKAKKAKPDEDSIDIREASSAATNKKTTSKKASTDPSKLKEQSTKKAASKKQAGAAIESSAPGAQPASKVQKTVHQETSTKPSACSSKGQSIIPSKAVSKEPAPAATASTKKKKKKRSFQDELLLHMFLSCKPFAVKDLAKHMNSNESAIEFSLLSLLDKQWVVKKDFTSKKGGRSKELYWGNQTAKNKELSEILRFISPEELREAHNELTNLQRQEVSLAKDLGQTMQEPSNDDLTTQLQNAEQEVQALETRLQATLTRIQSTQLKPRPPKGGKKGGKENNQRRVKIRINNMRAEWKKRKEKCIDFIDILADGMEKKVKDCFKLLELETDKSEGVIMPPKHVVD